MTTETLHPKTPSSHNATQQQPSALQRLLTYGKTDRALTVRACIYSILNKVFDVFPEILIGVAIDVVLKKEQSFLGHLGITQPWPQLLTLGTLTLLVWSLESLTEYYALYRWRILSQNLQHSLRMDGVRAVAGHSLRWLESQRSGSLLTTLGEDVHQISRFLDQHAHAIVQLLVSSLLVGAVFFYISPLVGSLALLPIPVIIVGSFMLRKRLLRRYQAVRQAAGRLSEHVSDFFHGILTLKAFVAETSQIERIHHSSVRYIEENTQAIRLSAAFTPIIRMAVLAGFLLTVIVGGYQTMQGEMNPAAYTVLMFLTQRLLWPFTRLGETVDEYQRAMASADRVLNLIEAEDTSGPGLPNLSSQAKLQTQNGVKTECKDLQLAPLSSLKLENVRFRYDESQPDALFDTNLQIEGGQFVAIVGGSGAGKSTILKLLLRFYEPSSGALLINEVSYSELAAEQIRSFFGYVGQDVFLFDGSIAENLRLGRQGLSDQDLAKAAQRAGIFPFIQSLPEGFATQVGERGQSLSGGQRQRLSIARALLGNPKVLILDEATSAVDNETEMRIQSEMRKLQKELNLTIVAVAHRLSTIRQADRIWVLDQGKVIENGNHQQLIDKQGTYHRLWNIQSGIETKA